MSTTPAQLAAAAATPRTARGWRYAPAALLAILGVASPHAAGQAASITLRPAVRVEGQRPVTLADIATLAGAPAEALGAVVVLPQATGDWTTLDLDAIRAAIDDQADPVWGHLTLTGGVCRVRAVGVVPPTPIDASAPDPQAPAAADSATVRGVIATRLALALSCDVSDLRLGFDPRDDALLGESAVGRTVDVQPTGFSSRMPLRVAIYEGDRILRVESIRVEAEVRRTVLVAPEGLDRGSTVDPGQLRVEDRWLAPDERPVAPEEAPGLVVRARVSPGQILTARAVEIPLAARRGQTISAHAVGGAVSLQLLARALENGRAGDIIRCESITSPRTTSRSPARQFLVRLAGPGVGVVVDEPHENDATGAGPSRPAQSDAPAPPGTGISVQRL